MTNIAIIGAGLAGLTAAHFLKNHADVTIFEKSRGVAGRMSTRRADPYAFDHGAQYFKAYTDDFKAFIEPMIKQGVIERWDARFATIKGTHIAHTKQWDQHDAHYVGAPAMSAMAKYLSQDIVVKLGVRVDALARREGQWLLIDEAGQNLGKYDVVIASVPAPQAAEILPSSLDFYSQISAVRMKGCFSLMLGFDTSLPLDFDAAIVNESDISWISVNSSKPKRGEAFSVLVHSSNKWADAHIDDDRETVMAHLCDRAQEILGYDFRNLSHKALHAWRYANIEKQDGAPFFIDTDQNIAVCGDWCIQGRVESAFTSGYKAAQGLLESLKSGAKNG